MKTTFFVHRMNKHRSFTHQKFRKRPNLHRNVTGEKGSEENPFVNRRKKLVEDAHRISRELEEEEAMALARAKAELERELNEARKALINDIQTTLAELPPLQVKTSGSTVITSEAFAWFYDESEPLVALRRCPLASGSYDHTIKLWNANTGECLRTLEGHNSSAVSVAFSPDGTTLASGSSDYTIKLWNANTGECLRTLKGHNHSVVSVAFSPIDKTFSRHDLNQIFIEVRAMLLEADFGLSTEDGIEFTVSWEALE